MKTLQFKQLIDEMVMLG
jgi:hypothetical protein